MNKLYEKEVNLLTFAIENYIKNKKDLQLEEKIQKRREFREALLVIGTTVSLSLLGGLIIYLSGIA